jgi:hypothetical protein
MKTIADIPPKGKLYQEVKNHLDDLTVGVALVVDPSIGSSSSSPGWAIYDKGKLSRSSTIDTGGSHLPLWERARKLGEAMHALCQEYRPDILVYEDIPATSRFNPNAQASLLKAVGVILACTDTESVIGIHPASWKNYVNKEYRKGDEEDAIEIGRIVTELARYISRKK